MTGGEAVSRLHLSKFAAAKESSDWAVAEVITWDRVLTRDMVLRVRRWFGEVAGWLAWGFEVVVTR